MKTFWAQFTRDGDYEENITANKRVEESINVIVNAESREQAIELLLESYPNTYHKIGQDKKDYDIDLGWEVAEIYWQGAKGILEITNNTEHKCCEKEYRLK